MVKHSIAHCVLCAVYFSAQPKKLRPILKFKEYYPIVSLLVGCHWKQSPYHWVQLNQASLASKIIVDHWPFHRLVRGRTKPFPVNDTRWIKQSNWPFYKQLKKLLTFLSLQNFTNWVQTKSAILNLTRIPNPRSNQMQLWLAPQCRKAGAATSPLLMMQLLSKSHNLFNIHKCVHCCLMINLNIWRLGRDVFVT